MKVTCKLKGASPFLAEWEEKKDEECMWDFDEHYLNLLFQGKGVTRRKVVIPYRNLYWCEIEY